MKDITSERLALSGIIKYGRNGFIEVSDIMETSAFTQNTNKVIWECLYFIFNNTSLEFATADLIVNNAKYVGLPDFFRESKNLEYLRAVCNTPLPFDNLLPLAKKLTKLKIIRDGVAKTEETAQRLSRLTGEETVAEIMNEIESPILDFSLGLRGLERNFHPIPITNDLRDHVEFLKNNVVDQIGIPSGFKWYDFAIGGGFRRQEIAMIAARPGRGKSFTAINIGSHIAFNLGIPTLYLYNEMSREQQLSRMLAIRSGVPTNLIETGKFSEDRIQLANVMKAVDDIENSPYYIHSILGLSVESVQSLIKRWIMKNVGFSNGKTNPCMIIYDYIKLPDRSHASNGLQEWAAVGDLVTSLCNFAEQYDCPILGFAQLNKEGDIAQTDRIKWAVSSLTFIRDVEEEDTAEIPDKYRRFVNRKFHFDKVRNADDATFRGNNFLCMNFQGICGRFKEIGPLSKLREPNFIVDADVQFNVNTGTAESSQ